MYFQTGDEIRVITDQHKLDGVKMDDVGIFQESVENDDIAIAICKVIFNEDRVVYIPEVSINHTNPEVSALRFDEINKQAMLFAKEKGIDINAELGIIRANDEGISTDHSVKPESETTAKPTRYNTGDIEVWDAIRLLGLDYMQGNVVKYTARYRNKNGSQDLFKALNYLVKIMSTELDLDFYDLRTKTVDELSVICERNGNGKTQEVS